MFSEKSRKYYLANPDPIRKRIREWVKNNPLRARVGWRRRRDRIRNLPSSFNHEQAEFSLKFWNGKCPVCDGPTNGDVHFDHWIPSISPDCPGTVAHNMLPTCPTCNLRKNRVMPMDWLKREFPERWEQIAKRITDYFQKVSNA